MAKKSNQTTKKWYKKPEVVLGMIGIVIAFISIPWWPDLLNDSANNNTSTTSNNSLNREYSIQRKVNEGKAEINLYDIKCGSKKYKHYESKGEFCVVDVTIVNRGEATNKVWPSDWKLYVGDHEFKAVSNEGEAFEDILPGSSGSGTVAFDVTVDSVPNSIVVDGPCCTDGVRVEF